MADDDNEIPQESPSTDKVGVDNLRLLENIEVNLTVEVGSTESRSGTCSGSMKALWSSLTALPVSRLISLSTA